jgi:L-ascorbate metabolism protein UlaG (beta-lactamase superfamily)
VAARAHGNATGDRPASADRRASTDRGGTPVDLDLRWLGHSTVLVELPGLTFLTDPLFRDRLGPLRRHGAVPDPSSLPSPDLVLVSHAHPDHFDRRSLRAVPGDPLLVVPRGLGDAAARAAPRSRVRETRLGEVVEHGSWRVHAVRARHWRWPMIPAARSLGYLVEGPLGVYFAGDTGRFREMRELAGRVDLALLPIGRWGPQPTPGHLTPESAARVAATIGARVAVPIHWGTLYPRGLERLAPGPLREPADRFRNALERSAHGVECRALAPGESVTLRLPARGSPVPAARPGPET